jgi:mycofactocin precursor
MLSAAQISGKLAISGWARTNFLSKEEVYVEEKSFEESPKEIREDMDQKKEQPMIIEEFEIEELSVDGICGVY